MPVQMPDGSWRHVMITDESEVPVVGESFRAAGFLVVCTRVEWRYMPPYGGKPVECSRREIAEACLSHGGHIACRGTYETRWDTYLPE